MLFCQVLKESHLYVNSKKSNFVSHKIHPPKKSYAIACHTFLKIKT
jgi:hypothetical protein